MNKESLDLKLKYKCDDNKELNEVRRQHEKNIHTAAVFRYDLAKTNAAIMIKRDVILN
jgi:hypothetical protein